MYVNDLWFVCLQQIREATKTDVVEPRLAALLDRISEYSNIPRKKAKFQVSDNVIDVGAQNGAWQISLLYVIVFFLTWQSWMAFLSFLTNLAKKMPLIYLSTMCEQPRTKDFVLLGSSQHKLIEPCYIIWILHVHCIRFFIKLNYNYYY